MKVIFLDIDGVLNSARSLLAFGELPMQFTDEHMKLFDPIALGMIRNITLAAGAKVVMSSSWRGTFAIKEFAQRLNLPVIDRTPGSGSGIRGSEIRFWLKDHPEVESYAIVDDSSDMLDEQLPFFVRCRMADGFSYENAETLARLMGIDIHDAMPGELRRKGLLPP